MIKLIAFKINFGSTKIWGQAFSKIEGAGPTNIIFQILA